MADAPRTIPLEELFPEAGSTQQPRRTRQPRTPAASPGITKQVFSDAFELASAGLSLAGANEYALSKEEIERMADSWYRLAKEYPAFGKQVVKGNRITVWGNLFIVNAIVVGKRVEMAVEWWQTRPKKTAASAPRPMMRPAPAPVAPAAPVRRGVPPAGTVEPTPEWGPSQPDLGGVLGPTGT